MTHGVHKIEEYRWTLISRRNPYFPISMGLGWAEHMVVWSVDHPIAPPLFFQHQVVILEFLKKKKKKVVISEAANNLGPIKLQLQCLLYFALCWFRLGTEGMNHCSSATLLQPQWSLAEINQLQPKTVELFGLYYLQLHIVNHASIASNLTCTLRMAPHQKLCV